MLLIYYRLSNNKSWDMEIYPTPRLHSISHEAKLIGIYETEVWQGKEQSHGIWEFIQ